MQEAYQHADKISADVRKAEEKEQSKIQAEIDTMIQSL
jgi:hypothetical protein